MDDSKSIKSNINSEMKLFEKFVDETVFSDDESLFPNNSDYENSDDSDVSINLSEIGIGVSQENSTLYDKLNQQIRKYICEVIEINGNCIIQFKRHFRENIDDLKPLLPFLIDKKYDSKKIVFIYNPHVKSFNTFFVLCGNPKSNFEDYKVNDRQLLFPSITHQFIKDKILSKTSEEFKNKEKLDEINYEPSNALAFLQKSKSSTSFNIGSFFTKSFPTTTTSTSTRTGIINPGNNCYLNALLQMLYDITSFRENILANNTQSNFITTNAELLDRYYTLKMYNSMFILSNIIDNKEFDEFVEKNKKISPEKLTELYYEKFINTAKNRQAEEKLKDDKIEFLQNLYGNSSGSSSIINKDYEQTFNDDIDLNEALIRQLIQDINRDPQGKKDLLIHLLKRFFENIEGTKTNLSFEPLLIPLLLFGNIEQQDTAEAFQAIVAILDINGESFFGNIEHSFTSTKYFTDSDEDFNNIKASLPDSRRLSEKTDANQKVFNLNLDEDSDTSIQALIDIQENPKINYGQFVNSNIGLNAEDTERYNAIMNENFLKLQNNNNDFFNSFTRDTATDFKDYIIFYLVRESFEHDVIDTRVLIEEITIEGQIYEPVGLIVRNGNNFAGHFYYIDIMNKKKYNDSFVSICGNECLNEEVLTSWRMALYRKKGLSGGRKINKTLSYGSKRKTFRVSRRKRIKSL
jgi:hypothetical protein